MDVDSTGFPDTVCRDGPHYQNVADNDSATKIDLLDLEYEL